MMYQALNLLNRATNLTLDSTADGHVFAQELLARAKSQIWVKFTHDYTKNEHLLQNMQTRLYLECDADGRVFASKGSQGSSIHWLINDNNKIVNMANKLTLRSDRAGQVFAAAALEDSSAEMSEWNFVEAEY